MSIQVRDFLKPLIERDPLGLATSARGLRKRVRQWWRHQHTDVYLVSFPGCGRTWLSMLMGKALVDELGIDAEPGKLRDLHLAHESIPRIRVEHDGDPQLKRPSELERDKRRFANKVVILLVRDPRDAFVSYYFEGSRRRGRFAGTVPEFLRSEIGSIDTLVDYYNIWAEQRHVPRKFCLVRYEDLRRDGAGELERVMRTMGHAPTAAVLERAVEFARFENMRKLEEQGVGHRALERNRDQNDTESFKTRKGKVGGYREYLSAEDLAYLESRIEPRLSSFFEEYRRPREITPS
jgi:hypothetical protein